MSERKLTPEDMDHIKLHVAFVTSSPFRQEMLALIHDLEAAEAEIVELRSRRFSDCGCDCLVHGPAQATLKKP
ncbi:hypothetical protein LCGC14_1183680 [marine sediment metagenome]|uniref:Uncharacterized protein n=1 Tax=marine sediment metagenome TaxID=412755 RepID=A0A0F9M977_9ZZZZ